MDQIWIRHVFVNGIDVLTITGNVRQTQDGEEKQFQSLVQLNFSGIKIISHASCFPTYQEAVDDVFAKRETIHIGQKEQ